MPKIQQALIVGLGQFGRSLARALAQRGVDVVAVDVDETKVRAIAGAVADAICLDATDPEALARLAPGRRDVCVCAIGDESREASIICTALLRQQGAPHVVARSNDPLHGRILNLVGAHEVINPEREFGERFVSQISHDDILAELRLGEGVLISEVRVPESFVAKTLLELALPGRFGVMVVAVRSSDRVGVMLPDPNAPLNQGDTLIVASKEGAVARLLETS